MSSPLNWHWAASSSCVNPSSSRRFRTCGPTMLAGLLVLAMRSKKSKLTLPAKQGSNCYAFLANRRNDNGNPQKRQIMRTTTRNPQISLSILLCAVTLHWLSFAGHAQPQYVQVGTLPAPTATERGKVFDTATETLFSFIYWTHAGAGGNSSDVYSSKVAGDAFSWTKAQHPAADPITRHHREIHAFGTWCKITRRKVTGTSGEVAIRSSSRAKSKTVRHAPRLVNTNTLRTCDWPGPRTT